jgi:hypothetical protein
MKRPVLMWGIILSVGVGGWFGFGATGFGQATGTVPPTPQPGGAGAVVPDNLAVTARAMAGDLRRLEQVIVQALGQTDPGRILGRDARELVQALEEFSASLNKTTSRFAARQVYSGIAQSANQLLGLLSRPGVPTPEIEQAARRVARDDALIHQALDLNPLPLTYYTASAAPSGQAEVKRLSRALNDRAEALADVIRADLRGPEAGRTAELAVNLSTAVDAFDDGIDINVTPAIARNGFATVDAMTNDLRRMLQGQTLTPRIRAARQSYLATRVLLRQALGLTNPPETLAGTALAPQGPSPVVALADSLLEQINAFINVFALDVGTIPEGNLLLADAQRLQTAAADFRQDTARGLTPGQLAYEFRDVDALWQRLARRTNRIARGRTSGYIEPIARMGQTLAEIHGLLGMPGFPARVAVPAAAPAPR